MKSVFVLTNEQKGPAGHGEPGVPYLTLRTNGGEWYTLGKPSPAFSTRENAMKYKKTLPYPDMWSITELELI